MSDPLKPRTSPDYYERPLSQESADFRFHIEKELDELEETIESEENPIKRLKLRKKAERLEYMLSWQGANPKEIDRTELRQVNTQPLHEDATSDKSRAAVKNPRTAIRAYCVSSCMCGQPSLVRECTSITCVLWPFRMGADPFRGYELPKVEEPELEIDEADIDDLDFEDDEDDEEDED